MRRVLGCVIVLAAALPGLAADKADKDAKPAPETKEVKITVVPAEPAAPGVTLTLGPRQGRVVPFKKGCAHTGGGNIDVAQPSADTIVVTMTGAAVATCAPIPSMASLDFDLNQCFEVVFEDKEIKRANLIIEGRVIGLLRGNAKCPGTAEASNAAATVSAADQGLVTITLPDHHVAGQGLSVNDHEGPLTVPVCAGKYTLHQTFSVGAHCPIGILPCHSVSAEFADGALDPLWLSHCEPFFGAAKKDFGFQITIKIVAEPEPEVPGEAVPAPKP